MDSSQWIWKPGTTSPNSYAWFEKTFTLNGRPDGAVFSVSAHNVFKLLVNGRRISPPFTPAGTVASKEKFYVSFDVGDILREGKNRIEVICLYLGGDGQNYDNAHPGMWFHGDITVNGKHQTMVSDDAWDVYRTIPYRDGMPFRENRRVSAVEHYDATREKSGKTKAVSSAMNDADPVLVPQSIPLTKTHATITPRCVHEGQGVMLFDLGEIVTGYVDVTVQSPVKQEITFRYGESADRQRITHRVANEPSDTYMDVLIVPAGETRHAADFTYKAFRFVQVEYQAESPPSIALVAEKVSTGIEPEGELTVDDMPAIRRLFQMAVKTHLNNTMGLLADCPHREQAQYLGDSDLQAEFLLRNFRHAPSLIRKVLRDFQLSQLDDGGFPFVAPGNYHHPEFHIRITEYDYFYVSLLDKLWRFTGDDAEVEPYLPTVERLLAFVETKYDENWQLIEKDDHWHINDWPYPSVDMDGQYLTAENIWAYRAFSVYETLCATLGRPRATHLASADIRQGIRDHLMDHGLLKDHEASTHRHQGVNALGLTHGIFREGETDHVLDHITRAGFSSSIILGREVLRGLLRHDRHADAVTHIFGHEHGWQAMLDGDGDTLWEGFDDKESHSHAWGSYPLALLQTELLHFRRAGDSQSTYTIEPTGNIPFGSVSCTFRIHEGVVSYRMVRTDDGFKLTLRFPDSVRIFHGSPERGDELTPGETLHIDAKRA